MGTILCATRGGPESYPNQDKAIELAKSRGHGLTFLYVSNVEFLDHVSGAQLVDLERSMDEMGEFLLVMARERALAQGVEADMVVMHGNFQQALHQTIRDHDISAVTLGSRDAKSMLSDSGYLSQLAKALHQDFDVEVIMIANGEIVEQRPS
jgi:nucleotide-binding universal stress UspA family protein